MDHYPFTYSFIHLERFIKPWETIASKHKGVPGTEFSLMLKKTKEKYIKNICFIYERWVSDIGRQHRTGIPKDGANEASPQLSRLTARPSVGGVIWG